MPIVTRFAPSPTGNLHIGGARTALFAWAFARQNHGQLILRIEDTDLARSTPQSTKNLIRDLKWLGLDWDQGPTPGSAPGSGDEWDPYDLSTQKGDHGPYFQSQRHEAGIYDELIEKLLTSGGAYEDGDAVRFRMDKDIAFDDAVYGHIEIKADDLEDFIIRKGEKGGRLPTFHFAVTVDDALMQVTHVIRGQEHLANTPKHAALCDALGFTRPQWVHLPSIMNADGSKMSKRDKAKAARKAAQDRAKAIGEDVLLEELIDLNNSITGMYPDPPEDDRDVTDDEIRDFYYGKNQLVPVANLIKLHLNIPLPEIEVTDFKDSGYLPTVLLNYIALLGWNPGDDTERFDMDFLVKHFDLARIGKKNSQFDRAKLLKFNAEALTAMNPNDFRHQLFKISSPGRNAPWYQWGNPDDPRMVMFAEMYQARCQTLSTPTELGRFFFSDDFEYNEKAVKKNLTKNDGEGLNVLKQFREVLAACDDWTADTLHKLIESFTEQHGLKNMGSVAQPLRVALTGNAVSPEIGPTLELLGKQTVLDRIDRCVNAISL